MATAIVHQLTNCSKTNQAPHLDTMPWVCAWSSSERQLIEACASRQCCSTNGDFKNWIWPIRRTSRVVRAGKMAEAAFPSLGYLCWWYHCYTGSMGMKGSLELLVSRKKPSLSISFLAEVPLGATQHSGLPLPVFTSEAWWGEHSSNPKGTTWVRAVNMKVMLCSVLCKCQLPSCTVKGLIGFPHCRKIQRSVFMENLLFFCGL